jgi:hypothetical protein
MNVRAVGLATVARTVRYLHPLQLLARPQRALFSHILRNVPAGLPPTPVTEWPRAPEALHALILAEKTRATERIARLPSGSRLRSYEEAYGLDIADPAVETPRWEGRTAIDPYPASVRARSLALAIRVGRTGLAPELARAARAALLQPELHLLGNHLLENGLGLACAGAATRGPEADLWWWAGVGLLSWQLPQQFLTDGGHIERSASYHIALTAALLELIELATAASREIPSEWREIAARALGWVCAVRAPDGTYPLFNDASLDSAPSIDQLLFLADSLAIVPCEVAHTRRGRKACLVTLPATGWLKLEVGSSVLLVDAAPDAGGWQPGHAHADGLTFELWVHRKRAIVDFGVASYALDEARARTRATSSHNTVELSGTDSCEVWSAFRVGRRGAGSVISADVDVSGDGVEVELEHNGYAWLAGRPHHRRRITLGERRLDVHDSVLGGSGQRFVSRIRMDAELADTLTVSAGPAAVVRTADVWYPRHGDARPALLFELAGSAADSLGARWQIRWT